MDLQHFREGTGMWKVCFTSLEHLVIGGPHQNTPAILHGTDPFTLQAVKYTGQIVTRVMVSRLDASKTETRDKQSG